MTDRLNRDPFLGEIKPGMARDLVTDLLKDFAEGERFVDSGDQEQRVVASARMLAAAIEGGKTLVTTLGDASRKVSAGFSVHREEGKPPVLVPTLNFRPDAVYQLAGRNPELTGSFLQHLPNMMDYFYRRLSEFREKGIVVVDVPEWERRHSQV